MSETLIGSEIVKLGGDIREKIRQGEKIYNFTVGDFDPSIFPIPKELEDAIVEAGRVDRSANLDQEAQEREPIPASSHELNDLLTWKR